MNLESLSQQKPAVLGFLQSVFGFAYIALIVTFLQNTSRFNFTLPEYIIAMVMLTLLVISATVMGIFFLGMPIYLVLKGNWPKALKILGFTLLFALLEILLLVGFALVIRM